MTDEPGANKAADTQSPAPESESSQKRRRGVWLVSLVASIGMVALTAAAFVFHPRGTGASEINAFVEVLKKGDYAAAAHMAHPDLGGGTRAKGLAENLERVEGELGRLEGFRASEMSQEIAFLSGWARFSGPAKFVGGETGSLSLEMRARGGEWRVAAMSILSPKVKYLETPGEKSLHVAPASPAKAPAPPSAPAETAPEGETATP